MREHAGPTSDSRNAMACAESGKSPAIAVVILARLRKFKRDTKLIMKLLQRMQYVKGKCWGSTSQSKSMKNNTACRLFNLPSKWACVRAKKKGGGGGGITFPVTLTSHTCII